MARCSMQTIGSVYYQARMTASGYNDKLKSREGAAEIFNMHPATLTKYENGTLRVPHDVVLLMAETYQSPELVNHYCTSDCPIGRRNMIKLENKDMMHLTVQLHMDTQRMIVAKEKMMKIMEDGIIEEHELADLALVMESLGQTKKTVSEMELWVEKYIKKSALHSEH